MPKRDSMRTKIMQKFEKLQKCLKQILMENKSKISFTVDGWTSVSNKSFYGITAHFVDSNWELQSVVLDFVSSNGKHTGKDIAAVFYKSLKLFHIENKCGGITVDNAAANTTFMEELQVLMEENDIYFDAKQQHFRCFAHILNLGVQDTLKLVKLQDMTCDNDYNKDEKVEDNTNDEQSCLIKLREIFKTIRLSEQWQIKLRSCCETTNVKYVSPSIDVSTRWNSTHNMIKIGLHFKNPINTLCENNVTFSHLKLNQDEWSLLEKFYKYFKVFQTVSTLLGSDKYVTLPMVIVGFNMLLDSIEKQIFELDRKIDRNEIDECLLTAFQAGRDKMLKHYSKTNWIYCASLILDPRHKIDTFDLTSWGKEMKEESIKQFLEFYKNYYDEKQNDDNACTERTETNEDDICIDSLYMEQIIRTPIQEFETYMNAPRASKETSVLSWWKLNEVTYPTLSTMAKDIFGITATSIPAERLFSKASLVIRKHRNRLNETSARIILCINSWLTCSLKDKIQNIKIV